MASVLISFCQVVLTLQQLVLRLIYQIWTDLASQRSVYDAFCNVVYFASYLGLLALLSIILT